MTSFNITVKDEGVQSALKALAARVSNLNPVLDNIGIGIIERTRHRFDTSSAPDGTPWKPNSAATLAMLAGRLGGQKSKVKKDGSLNASGQRSLDNKKPLIGESKDLRTQFTLLATDNTLTVGSTPKYAAIQQFGGKAGRGHKVSIPARPFLPIRQDGSLYPAEQAQVLQALNDFLLEGL